MKGPFGLLIWEIRAEKDWNWHLQRSKNKHKDFCQVKYCSNGTRDNSQICHKCHSREYRANNPEKYAYKNLKVSARIRNIPVTISFEQFKEFIDGTDYMKRRGPRNHHLQVDRIDAAKGYELGNIQLVTGLENKQRNGRREPECPF